MRIPLVGRPGDGRRADDPPAWWEWLFAPVVLPLIFAVGFGLMPVVVAYFALYPERHFCDRDLGRPRDQEVMARYRRFCARVSVWRRLGRLATCYCYRQMFRASRRGARDARVE
jgi:hypothetical protein